MKIQNKKGFSLIELSIVLIIIGLLVAGITGGASLIKGAEIRSIITEANQFTVAVNTFYMSEGGLPGDSTAGNSNGRIEYVNDLTGGVYEGQAAWFDMANRNLIDLSIDTAKNKIEAGVSAPRSRYKGSAWGIEYSNATNSNVLFLTGNLDATASNAIKVESGDAYKYLMASPAVIISPTAAKSVDTKMDDGKPGTGSVRGVGSTCYSNGTSTVKGASAPLTKSSDESDPPVVKDSVNKISTSTDDEYTDDKAGNLCSITINLAL